MYQSKVESVRHCFTEIFIKITMLISMLCSRCCLCNVLSAQVIVVQGFTSLINVHRLNIFLHLLSEGSVYQLGAFDVTRRNRNVFVEISKTVQTNTDGALQVSEL